MGRFFLAILGLSLVLTLVNAASIVTSTPAALKSTTKQTSAKTTTAKPTTKTTQSATSKSSSTTRTTTLTTTRPTNPTTTRPTTRTTTRPTTPTTTRPTTPTTTRPSSTLPNIINSNSSFWPTTPKLVTNGTNNPVFHAFNWQDGDNWQIKYASDCDFNGNDLGYVQTYAEYCGAWCLYYSQCDHFTWYLGYCYLKKMNGLTPTTLKGATCGYAVNRQNGNNNNNGGMDKNSNDYQTLLKTIYAEARGESQYGQQAVAWVIRNRAVLNRSYWGGNTIAGVCRAPYQFECWNGVSDIYMSETAARNAIDAWLPNVFQQTSDPTGGSQYYNNPDKEGYPAWTYNVKRTVKIGNHQFYKE